MKANRLTKPITKWRLYWHSLGNLGIESPMFELTDQSSKNLSTQKVKKACSNYDSRFHSLGWELKKIQVKNNKDRMVWKIIETKTAIQGITINVLISAKRI